MLQSFLVLFVAFVFLPAAKPSGPRTVKVDVVEGSSLSTSALCIHFGVGSRLSCHSFFSMQVRILLRLDLLNNKKVFFT